MSSIVAFPFCGFKSSAPSNKAQPAILFHQNLLFHCQNINFRYLSTFDFNSSNSSIISPSAVVSVRLSIPSQSVAGFDVPQVLAARVEIERQKRASGNKSQEWICHRSPTRAMADTAVKPPIRRSDPPGTPFSDNSGPRSDWTCFLSHHEFYMNNTHPAITSCSMVTN